MIYQITDKAYRMTRDQFKQVIKVLKSKHRGMHVILAVEKDGIAIALKDTYDNSKSLLDAVQEWNSKGYKVIYNL